MAGSRWVRLDVGYFTNPKIVRAGRDAAMLHLAAICYLGDHQVNDGVLPVEVVPILARWVQVRQIDATVKQLVKCQLWHEHDRDWIVHDFENMNGTYSEAVANRDRQRRFRAARRERDDGGKP